MNTISTITNNRDYIPTVNRIYTVKKDDSLFKIAKEFLGDGNRWKDIHDLNPEISSPNLIYPGQKIKIPVKRDSSKPVITDENYDTYQKKEATPQVFANPLNSNKTSKQGFILPVEKIRIVEGGRWGAPRKGKSNGHKGVDFAAGSQKVRAVADGVVTFAGKQKDYGNIIIIKHSNGLETAYAHLNSNYQPPNKGAHIRQGEMIGVSGNSGNADGICLHFEVRRGGVAINPMPFLGLS